MEKLAKPFISVIIPTFNRLMILSECIEALWQQQMHDQLEIIIVNDCGEPVHNIEELYPELHIQIINLERNMKHVHARNEALRIAQGDYVLLCDDDDIILPGHIEAMLVGLEHADLVYSDVEIVSYSHTKQGRIPQARQLFAYHSSYEQMRSFSTFVASGCMYRRSLHNTLGLFDVEMANYWDWDFYLRAAAQYKAVRVPIASVLYAFSDDGQHASAELNERRQANLQKLCDKHQLGTLPQKNFFLLLQEPEMLSRQASSQIVWDGKPIRSRYEE